MELTSTRHLYPLAATYARRFVGLRDALIGDSAVGMHPVTAHGFNLGLLYCPRSRNSMRSPFSGTARAHNFHQTWRDGVVHVPSVRCLWFEYRPPSYGTI
jgi:hypothetical protein